MTQPVTYIADVECICALSKLILHYLLNIVSFLIAHQEFRSSNKAVMAESKSVKDVDEGDYVMIDGNPCMVLEVPDDEEAECKISGQDVLDGTEHTHTYSGDDTIQTFTPTYEECEVVSPHTNMSFIYTL